MGKKMNAEDFLATELTRKKIVINNLSECDYWFYRSFRIVFNLFIFKLDIPNVSLDNSSYYSLEIS